MTITPDHNPEMALLRWYAEMGIDEVVSHDPSDMTAWGDGRKSVALNQPQKVDGKIVSQTAAAPLAPQNDEAIAKARALAKAATNVAELRAAIQEFDGCALKLAARHCVIDDGIDGTQRVEVALLEGCGPTTPHTSFALWRHLSTRRPA